MYRRFARALLLSTVAIFCGAHIVRAEDAPVQIFAAGSLRGVVGELAAAVGPALKIELLPSFGGSGSLRERVENGARPDLLLSADLASPRSLAASGRTIVPAIAFGRNRLCLVSRRALGITTSNLVDRLLEPGTRIKTSTPVADPAGDYAWAVFDHIDRLRPGAGAVLKAKAETLMNAAATPATATPSAAAALFLANRIDVTVTYCSAAAGLLQEVPELTSLDIPAALDPRPVYGLALLSSRPAAMQVALFLLSDKGQAILQRNGLLPGLEAASPDGR